MPWPDDTPLRIGFLLLILSLVGPFGISAEGNAGCLFSDRLCLDDEWCFDDYIFGRCLPTNDNNDEDDLYRYNLDRTELHQISHELRRLFALGYRWSHAYTQCRLQAMLYAYRHDISLESNACSHLVDQDLEGALRAFEAQYPVDPKEIAIIKYTPSVDNPHARYADEIYYPPVNEDAERDALREQILPSNAVDIMDMEDPYAQYEVVKRTWIPQMHRRSLPPTTPKYSPNIDDNLEFLPVRHNYDDIYPVVSSLDKLRSEYHSSPNDDSYNRIVKLLQQFDQEDKEEQEEEYNRQRGNFDIFDYLRKQNNINEAEEEEDQQEAEEFENDPFERFTLTYNTPENFRSGWESRDLIQDEIPESRIYFDEDYDDNDNNNNNGGSGLMMDTPHEIFRELKQQQQNYYDNGNNNQEIFRELKNKHKSERSHRIYTEGGVVYSPTDLDNYDNSDGGGGNDNRWDFDQILNEYNLGFKRPERLDVKKPGPPFDTQNHKVASTEMENNLIPTMMKKGPIGVHPNPTRDVDYVNDMDYIYITFKNIFRSWKEGEYIIRNITKLLKFEQPVTLGRIDHNQVTFKIIPNSRGLNATEVAKKIDSIKDDLKTSTGAEITSIGIGDRASVSAMLTIPTNNERFYIVIFLVCGVLGAMIIATSLLILIKRHLKSKEKLQNLSRPDSEASKDYQDLCRARMAAKGQQQVTDPIHGRITSLSRESEQSPSSRSSTSSWSEEPTLHNMDISTGHMVLSYMEDHLKNKDRLEQEWVALCAYVAEPSDTTIALKKENIEKNRYPDIIPYDHSRVVLNELSNISGSDYINASTITDHDPRNPAYIATQGPLPHTAADFWQLIWEQGAVVIVMLTRLTENGTAMCHRYWPEEGSELYHIHEVHLVSEHIWCDDYLVRSFYLKNIRTGETRTVTQFHFLSWPEAGVPASTKALLEFRRKVNKSYRGRSCPIVVHCSDGAGRTGTYCLIDMVLSRMAKGAKEIDIAATLEHLRDQRPKMVATKQQFEFVLTAVAEEVHAILKALPPQAATNTQQQQQQQQQQNDKQEKQ